MLYKKLMIVGKEHWRIKNNLCLFLWCKRYDIDTINFKRVTLKEFYGLCHSEEFRKSKYVIKLGRESVEEIKPLSWIYDHKHLYISDKVDITQKPTDYNWLKHIWRKLKCYIRNIRLYHQRNFQ